MVPQGELVTDCDVLILGGSMAGIELVHQLRRSPAGRALRIVVIDRQAAHGYIPLAHERLCGRLPMSTSELATAQQVENAGNRYVLGELVGIDAHTKTVELASGERVSGRFVVVALGSALAAPHWLPGREHLLGYKFATELDESRTHLEALLDGSRARIPQDNQRRGQSHGTDAVGERRLVVIGGGISGVELAGELAHLARVRPPGWRAPAVTLIHSGTRLLPELPERAGRRAESLLRQQHVDVCLRTRVVQVERAAVMVQGPGGATEIPCDGAYWAGGLQPAEVLADLDLPRTPTGWLSVDPKFQCSPVPSSHPGIFAFGDAVRVVDGTSEWPTVQRASECLPQAKVVARNIMLLAAEPPEYPNGVPPLVSYRPHSEAPYGVNIGGAALLVIGRLVLNAPRFNTWVRRSVVMPWYLRRHRVQ
jgi:NADH dehydrogenase